MPGTLHDGVSLDTGMDTSYQKSLVVSKDQRAMGNGDRIAGGISLVSKFKVTNLVLIEDEEASVVDVTLPLDLSRTVQTPHALLELVPQLLFLYVMSPYSWDRGRVVLNLPNGAWKEKIKTVFCQ